MKNIFSGGRNTLIGSGTLASKVILLVSGIDILILNGSIDVEIRPGNVTKAEIIADDNLIDLVLVDQLNDTITIDMKDNSSYTTQNSMKVILYLPYSLSSIFLNGDGDINSYDGSCKKLGLIELDGDGDIKIDTLETTSLKASLMGDGDIILQNGTIDNVTYSLTGNGDILAQHVVCKTVVAILKGDGDIKLHAKESLDATIDGDGDIIYYGSPLKVSKRENGDGDIIKK